MGCQILLNFINGARILSCLSRKFFHLCPQHKKWQLPRLKKFIPINTTTIDTTLMLDIKVSVAGGRCCLASSRLFFRWINKRLLNVTLATRITDAMMICSTRNFSGMLYEGTCTLTGEVEFLQWFAIAVKLLQWSFSSIIEGYSQWLFPILILKTMNFIKALQTEHTLLITLSHWKSNLLWSSKDEQALLNGCSHS